MKKAALPEALEEMEAAMRQRTDAAASDLEEFEDDALDGVAGGAGNEGIEVHREGPIMKLKDWGCTSASA